MNKNKTKMSLCLLFACGTLLAGCGQTFSDCFVVPSGSVAVGEDEAKYVSNIVTKNLKYVTGYNQYSKEEESNEYFKGTPFENSLLEFGSQEVCIEENTNFRIYNNYVVSEKVTANYKIEYAGKNAGMSMNMDSITYVQKSNNVTAPDSYDLLKHEYTKIDGEISGEKETEENYISRTGFANDDNDLLVSWESYKISKLEVSNFSTTDFYKNGNDYFYYHSTISDEELANPIDEEDKTKILMAKVLEETIIKFTKDSKKGYVLSSLANIERKTLDVDLYGNILENPVMLSERKSAKIYLYDDNGNYDVPEYSIDSGESQQLYTTIFKHETGDLISSFYTNIYEDKGANDNPSCHTYSRIIKLSKEYDYSFYFEGYEGNDQFKWEDITSLNVPEGLLVEGTNGHIHPTKEFDALINLVVDDNQNLISFTISIIYGNIN